MERLRPMAQEQERVSFFCGQLTHVEGLAHRSLLVAGLPAGEDRCQSSQAIARGVPGRPHEGRRALGARMQGDLQGRGPWTREAESTYRGIICRCIRLPCCAIPLLAGVRIATSAWGPQGTMEGSGGQWRG